MVRPAVSYVLEMAALTRAQVAEMKMLTYETVVSRKDKIKNENIRQTLGIEDNLIDKIS